MSVFVFIVRGCLNNVSKEKRKINYWYFKQIKTFILTTLIMSKWEKNVGNSLAFSRCSETDYGSELSIMNSADGKWVYVYTT